VYPLSRRGPPEFGAQPPHAEQDPGQSPRFALSVQWSSVKTRPTRRGNSSRCARPFRRIPNMRRANGSPGLYPGQNGIYLQDNESAIHADTIVGTPSSGTNLTDCIRQQTIVSTGATEKMDDHRGLRAWSKGREMKRALYEVTLCHLAMRPQIGNHSRICDPCWKNRERIYLERKPREAALSNTLAYTFRIRICEVGKSL
jgi:hypothetical protein